MSLSFLVFQKESKLRSGVIWSKWKNFFQSKKLDIEEKKISCLSKQRQAQSPQAKDT